MGVSGVASIKLDAGLGLPFNNNTPGHRYSGRHDEEVSTPYIVFYPTVSRDSMPFPVDKYICEVQGRDFFQEAKA